MATRSESYEKEAAYVTDVPIGDENSEGWAQDDRDMARMGKKQEFMRNFGWISSVGFTSCTMDKSITARLDISMLTYIYTYLICLPFPSTLIAVLTSTLRSLSRSITSNRWWMAAQLACSGATVGSCRVNSSLS